MAAKFGKIAKTLGRYAMSAYVGYELNEAIRPQPQPQAVQILERSLEYRPQHLDHDGGSSPGMDDMKLQLFITIGIILFAALFIVGTKLYSGIRKSARNEFKRSLQI